MRVAVVHDYLAQRGGAERVALAILEAFPESQLFTSVYSPGQTFPEFSDHQITTLWTNRVPGFRREPRRALPVLAQAFGSLQLDDFDAVICSSSGWAHGVRTRRPKVVYCHNPARWLYQPDDYFGAMSQTMRGTWRLISRPLIAWDRTAAASAHEYLVNSTTVRRRVEETYGRQARVLHPPAGLVREGPERAVSGLSEGYFLTVGRARGYKNTEVVVNCLAANMDHRLVVVGVEAPTEALSSSLNVKYVGKVSDEELRWLYRHARGVIALSYEDFGLTPVEAFLFGKPVIALRYGGFLDTVVEHVSGVFADLPTVECLTEAIRAFDAEQWDTRLIEDYGQRFESSRFRATLQQVVKEAVAGAGTSGN